MNEPAGMWIRVSSLGQDEENQVPDNMAWIEGHNYDHAATYTVHGGSAFKGNKKFDATWAQVISDLVNGVIKVLVVWKQDRLDRKLNTFQMIKEVVDAGGRVEFVTQPHLNDLSTMGNRIALKVQEEIAHQESKDKSDRVKIVHNRIRENGGLIGRLPFGYTSEGEKYSRKIVTTDEGEAYAAEMFNRVISGQSLQQISNWLEEKTGHKFWARTIGTYIRNTTYIGWHGDVKCPALVDADVFKRAGEALDSRPKRGAVKEENRALCAGMIFCSYCDDSPMYKINGGYYRCSGRGRNRKGCGNMIPMHIVDTFVSEAMENSTKKIMKRVFVPGHNHDAEIEEVKFQIKRLGAEDLDDDEYDRKLADLRSERNRLQTLPNVPDEWRDVDTGETYASRWERLTGPSRGNWLREAGTRIYAGKDDGSDEYATPDPDSRVIWGSNGKYRIQIRLGSIS